MYSTLMVKIEPYRYNEINYEITKINLKSYMLRKHSMFVQGTTFTVLVIQIRIVL